MAEIYISIEKILNLLTSASNLKKKKKKISARELPEKINFTFVP